VLRYSAILLEAVNIESMGINGNHIQMVQFHSPTDDGYKKVSSALCTMVEDTPRNIADNWKRWGAINGT